MRYLLKEYREKRRDDGKQSKRIEICQNQNQLYDRILSASPSMQRDGRLERMRALLKKNPGESYRLAQLAESTYEKGSPMSMT